MGDSSNRPPLRGAETQLGAPWPTGSAVLIRADIPPLVNAITTETPADEIRLPETQRELELLLEALHALSDALDEYENIGEPADR